MKKIIKRSLLVIGIIVGIFVILFVGLIIKVNSEWSTLTPMETQKVLKNVSVIKDNIVNMYLIKDSSNYIAMDAGQDIDAIKGELEKLEIDPAQVRAVFLSHSDMDHAAAVTLFKNADIYLSLQEEQMINGATSRILFIGNELSVKDYKLVEDKQVINIGNTKIQGILTSGHTPGAMCYVINDSLLFTGDALSLENGKIKPFNDFFNMDTEIAVKSMTRVTNIPGVKYIFTAHHGYTDDYINAVKEWR